MIRSLTVLFALLLPVAVAADEVVHHDIRVVIDPADGGRLQVDDRLVLAPELARRQHIIIRLNAGFGTPLVDGAQLESSAPLAGGRLLEHTLRVDGDGALRLRYSGGLVLSAAGAGPGEWFDAHGAHLGAGSAWYPRVADALITFDVAVTVPPGWRALAPGRAVGVPPAWRWSSDRPVEDLDLVAGPFTEYLREETFGPSLVWLRETDVALADTYLDAVGRYLPFYAQLLGAYPHSKFAVVENLRPTGWGMPSFTLLGSRVMRLPFIPHTSLPHEVVHNWWGNGVLVDLDEGNWSEGLTAYLADHLQAQRRGRGVRHRRDALARFRSAGGEAPAPVSFVSRHDRRSQSVGYDKPLMLFHMARRARGDVEFVTALRALYRVGLGRRVGAREVLEVLAPPGEDWFASWWSRAGAPRLQLECCDLAMHDGRHRLRGTLRQVQAGAPYPVRVPVQVLVAGEEHAREHIVDMNGGQETFEIETDASPLLLEADAGFDVMRIPHREELPPSLAEALDALDPVALLDADVSGDQARAYAALAARMGARVVPGPDPPASAGAVWLLGAGNQDRWHGAMTRLVEAGSSRVMVTRGPSGRPIVVLDAASAAATRALTGKLAHYGRYGLLGFDTDRARNVFKGERPVDASPMRVVLDPAARGRDLPLAAEVALGPP